ncbi:MAG: HAD family hydrolase [Deltaproteobacteria bacterium]|nr:HAD family hydrolase [Deltaproteobacteria bacterium]
MRHPRKIQLNGSAYPLHAIAFDLDSTLTRPYLDFTRLRRQLNMPEGDILRWVATLLPKERKQALRMIDTFEQDGVENVEWNDGAQETLATVQAMGLPTAIVTRNSRASLLAVCQRLAILVDVLVAREDAPPKPDPACLHHTARQLDVPIAHLLMVGDYRHDTDAGRAAGARTVLLTNGRVPSWEVDADLVIHRLSELLMYIEE